MGGPKHGVSGSQTGDVLQSEQMQKKARQVKHGNHPTIFSRWKQERYRESLTEHNFDEKEVMHEYTATKAEGLQTAKRWFFV